MFHIFYNPYVFLTKVPYSPLHHYFPRRAIPRDDLALTTEDGVRLSAWLLRAEDPQGYVLYLRGNGGRLADWAPHAAQLVEMGQSVLLIDYRGYGESQGRPSERGLYRDGEAAWRWLARRAHGEGLPAVILGKSMGTSIAAHVAVRHARDGFAPDGMILDSPFTSMRETISYRAKWLPKILIPRFFETESFVANVRCPTMIVHGDRDGVVPIGYARRLYDRLRCPSAMVEVPGATHGGLTASRAYHDAVRAFLADPVNVERMGTPSTDLAIPTMEGARLQVS